MTDREGHEAYMIRKGREMDAKQRQVGGDHYRLKIQPIDFIRKNEIPFVEGNIIKYVIRHRKKNGKEDLEKAMHYIQLLLEDYND